MQHYNTATGYNKIRYNGDGTELSAADSISLADGTVAKQSLKRRSELLVMSETIAKQQNKSVTDSIRINDWTRFKKDQAELWSD